MTLLLELKERHSHLWCECVSSGTNWWFCQTVNVCQSPTLCKLTWSLLLMMTGRRQRCWRGLFGGEGGFLCALRTHASSMAWNMGTKTGPDVNVHCLYAQGWMKGVWRRLYKVRQDVCNVCWARSKAVAGWFCKWAKINFLLLARSLSPCFAWMGLFNDATISRCNRFCYLDSVDGVDARMPQPLMWERWKRRATAVWWIREGRRGGRGGGRGGGKVQAWKCWWQCLNVNQSCALCLELWGNDWPCSILQHFTAL